MNVQLDARPATARATVGAAPLLRADGICLATDARVLLRPVSLELGAGELVAVIGPSGAGKTSLLRALTGIAELRAGAVELAADEDGRLVRVGFVPAEDLLHDELTVFEELLFAARLRCAPGEDPLEHVMDVMAELRLTELTDARVATLSKGERRRTSCGVELVGGPRVLVLDEPASGLDPGLEQRLMLMLRRLADDGRGVLVATHATQSLHCCDRVIAMAPGGVVRYDGPPARLPQAFGVADLAAVYTELGRARSDDLGAPPPPVPAGAPRATAASRPVAATGQQLPTVLARAALCRLRDRRSLGILLGQAPVLGAAIAVVLPRGMVEDGSMAPFYGLLLCFMLTVASVWLGVIAACREVVAERPIIDREIAIGVRPHVQVLAKILTLMPLVAAQAVLLAGVVLVLQPLPEGALLVVGLCVVTAWAAAAMGLWLSAAARTADQATTSVPLLLIPQLLFAGALIPVDRMLPPLQVLADAVLARWALSGFGGAIGLEERVGSSLSGITGLQASFFAGPATTPLLAAAVVALVSLGFATRALTRRPGPAPR